MADDITLSIKDDPTITLTLSGGSTVSGGSDQNLFATVAGDTGSTTADSTTDTLTIAGGTNVTTAVSGDTITISATGGGSGEANTASNQGAGVGVFDEKTGVDLEFRSLVAASTKISITLDDANDEVDFDVVEANIDHGSISGLADDDHTQYLLADGTRDLTGDWTIASNSITLTGGDLTLSNGTANLQQIQMETGLSAPTHSEGLVYWDDDDKTLAIMPETSDVTLQVGQETWLRATNKTGVQIDNGSVIYIDGAQGQKPNIALADADLINSSYVVGIATMDIADNATGYVTTSGIVRGLDTSSFSDGDKLYLSQTAGGLTSTAPTSPAASVSIGYVVYSHATEGKIYVHPEISSSLNGIHDVEITSVADNDLVQYNNSNSRWENVTLAAFESSLSITESQISDLDHSVNVVSNVAQDVVLGRVTAGSGDSEELTATQVRTLINVEDGATADMSDAEIKTAYENNADTNAYTDAEQTKVGHISVTQAVDLDQMETDIAALDQAVILQGTWDASAGTFPGSGSAQAGYSYIVSVSGTVDGEVFVANDRIVAITDNASTTTYASNWHKLDYTDAVLSVAGKTGAVTLVEADITDLQAYLTAETNDLSTTVTWANVPDANITESSVTQHEAAIDHDALLNFVAAEHIDWTADAGASNIHVNNITAVPEGAVTAHEAAITITESQISDLGSYITGNETITLSGDVTGTGTTAITTTIAAGAVDLAMLSATGTPSASNFLRGDNTWATPAGSGDVSGPGSSTDNALVRWDGTSGTTVQNSGIIIDDSDNVTEIGNITGTSGNRSFYGSTGASAELDIRATSDGSNRGLIKFHDDLYIDQAHGVVGVGVAPSTLTNKEELMVGGRIAIEQVTSPLAESGYGKVYMKSDGDLYFMNGSGTEYNIIDDLGGDVDQNLWETVSADTGSTSADTTSDTLTVAGGTDISTSISGDTLTIAYSGSGASPAGNNYEIQYNANGSFGAESIFRYDYDTNTLVVGKASGEDTEVTMDMFRNDTAVLGDTANAGVVAGFSNDTAGDAFIKASANSTGDSGVSFSLNDTTGWVIGVDNSDSDKLKFNPAYNSLTSAVALVMDASGNATFTGDVSVSDEVYGVAWNGSVEVPTKNAVYDKIEGLALGDADQNLWETVSADTGSTSADTTTDTLTIAGGTDITTSISGDILTVAYSGTAGDPDQNLFLNVVADTGANLVADTTTDTLTVTGGTGISTANDAVTDTLTISVDDNYLLNTGDAGTGAYNFGAATTFEIPNSSAPTLDTNGQIAVDTNVNGFSAGVLKYHSGEEMAVVSMPVAQLVSPTNNHVVTYDATADEFILAAATGAEDQNLWETVAGDTGSTAADTVTDTLTIAGGTGISTAMSGDTLTVTNDSPNVDQNIFETVTSDSGSAVADTTTDTLTLAGGSGISTSASADTITIAADAATDSASGVVELATIAEVDTGTDTTRAVTPDALQGSNRNLKFMAFTLVGDDTDVAADTSIGGDFRIPFSGTLIQDDSNKHYCTAFNTTAGTTGTMVVDVHLNGTSIMTTNKLDIESGEKTTADATTQPDLTTTSFSAGDILTFDVDAIHTTAAKGLRVMLAYRPD